MLFEKLLCHDNIIFVTPIYWYSMCSGMKKFFERLSLKLTNDIKLRNSLKGKDVYVICSYGNPKGKAGFEEAFANTFYYLGMQYHGCLFYYASSDKVILEEKDIALRNSMNKKLFYENHC